MDSVIRGLIVYFFLLLIFRIAGKRTLSETTNFDFVLLLIVSETIQQAMVSGDSSLTNAFLLVITLVGASIALSLLKQHSPEADKWLDGTPTIVIDKGKLLQDRMDKIRVDENDILEAARRLQGLERLEQIKYAVVERGGEITIVPAESSA